jgi:sugar/nucleoside kinase (ribokinase family)
VACARLGLNAAPVIFIGDDPAGKQMVSTLRQEGVNTEVGLHIVPGGYTAHSFLFVDPENRHQTFYYPGVSDWEDEPVQLENKTGGENIRWGAITVGNAHHNTIVMDWLAGKQIPILWSHKNDSLAFPRELVERLVAVCRILILNTHEAEALQVMFSLSNVEDLLNENLQTIILTKGAQGCRVIERDIRHDVPAVSPTEVIDPTGAGDAFAAGVLFGLCHDLPMIECARIGAITASFALEALGCQTGLPSRKELLTRYRQEYGQEIPRL